MPRQRLINTAILSSRKAILLVALLLPGFSVSARMVKETLKTKAGDEFVVKYEIEESENDIVISFLKPKVSLSSAGSDLRKDYRGNAGNIKVVLFEKKFIPGKTKFKGVSFNPYSVPSGLKNESDNPDGYYIFGESPKLEFTKNKSGAVDIRLPLYVALYKNKGEYAVYEELTPILVIKTGEQKPYAPATESGTGPVVRASQRLVEETVEVDDVDNLILIQVSDCMNTIRQLLSQQSESPFSPILTGEIQKLQTLSTQVRDENVRKEISDLMLECNAKDAELREAGRTAAQMAADKEKEDMKADAEAQRKEAEKQTLEQEEKQRKRTIWMIIGGALIAVVAFIGNALFKRFRDIKNQKSIQAMQDSIIRKAQGEATRRSREVVRNKAHQMVNKGRTGIRQAAASARNRGTAFGTRQEANGNKVNGNNNSKIKSI